MSDELKKEAERAIGCLYIAVDESVANDVQAKVFACIDKCEADLAELTAERDKAQAGSMSLYAKHTLALLAMLEAHQYYANGSDVLARDAITRFLKAQKLVEDDGVTWTRDALEISGDNFSGEEI